MKIEEDKNILEWYRNFVRFSKEYFPGEKIGVQDKLYLMVFTRKNYELLNHQVADTRLDEERITGANLLRAVQSDMNSVGYKTRRTL